MRTMIAKYPGTCCDCGKPIKAQTPIKFYGRGRAAHQNCFNADGKTENEIAAEYRGKCWNCDSMDGRFRRMGAATPVWCDECFEENRTLDHHDTDHHGEDEAAGFEPGTLANDRRMARNGVSVVRFSSGAVMTQNSRGRCEDAPCCGCCS